MDEALEILWTYARREPLDNNGDTIVPTINNSIAAIRIIMRLEGWAMGSEKRKVNSEKRATPAYATSDKPASHRRGEWQFAQSQNTQYNTYNNTNNHNEGELPNMGELPFAPTPAQHQFAQHQYP